MAQIMQAAVFLAAVLLSTASPAVAIVKDQQAAWKVCLLSAGDASRLSQSIDCAASARHCTSCTCCTSAMRALIS